MKSRLLKILNYNLYGTRCYSGCVTRSKSLLVVSHLKHENYMKIIIILSIVLLTIFVHPSLFAQPQSTSTGDSLSGAKRQFLLADITGFPFNHTLSGNWRPYQSMKVGYGRKIVDHVEIRVYVDYARFNYDYTEGWAGTFNFSRGNTRRDISLYPAVVFFKFAEIAVGCSYTTQDEVIHIVNGNTNLPITTIDPAVKEFGVYFHFGVGGTIHIAGPIGIPLGILIKTDGPNGISVGCRAGIEYEI
jgi:hypothetical protein